MAYQAAAQGSIGLSVLHRTISPNQHLPPRLSIIIKVNWDIATSMRPDREDFNLQQFSLAHQTVLATDGKTLELTTPIRYINARWPNLGSVFVSVLESHLRDVLKSGSSSDARNYDSWPLAGLDVDYFSWDAPVGLNNQQEAAIFEIRGQPGPLADLIDAIAWLSACFRCYQNPQLYASQVDIRLDSNVRLSRPTIFVSPTPLTILRRLPGVAWHHLLRDGIYVADTSSHISKTLKLSITELMKLVRTRSEESFVQHKGSTVLLGRDCILVPMLKRPDGCIDWKLFITKEQYSELPKTPTTYSTWDASRPCWKDKSEERAFERYNDRTKLALETIDKQCPLATEGRFWKTKGGARARFAGWEALEDAPAHFVRSWDDPRPRSLSLSAFIGNGPS